MRKEEFVPGEIYYVDTNRRIKYYYVGPNNLVKDQGVFQEISSGITYIWRYESPTYEWKEYKESRKGTRWMNVYENDAVEFYSTTFASKSDADSCKTNRIACIEVPWVEGQGL